MTGRPSWLAIAASVVRSSCRATTRCIELKTTASAGRELAGSCSASGSLTSAAPSVSTSCAATRSQAAIDRALAVSSAALSHKNRVSQPVPVTSSRADVVSFFGRLKE